ncbi:ABC-type amino acid transport substrate-binding protein [Roseomonas rosea]|uniref:ABC-type amino acid transport substrate-binding protein n=1 Tax=Muricoccus roseus TaxID=198092 RepID=A0A1M6MM57_9PROT|nr:ABC transporter substrate-binding protein [Roseomonas rosea]SHJ84561.1 ABC-type amino acid transport substrate-binding protein [Roseomonas rosea]
MAQNVASPGRTAPVVTPDRSATVRARRELLVCTAPDLPSISWRNHRNGELEGLDADIAHALAARLSVRPVFVETAPGGVIDMVERGACDLGMGGLGVSPARAARVAFTTPFLAGPLAAITQRARSRVAGWTGLDREGVVVAVLAGSVAEEVMRQHARQAEILPVRPPMVPEQEISAGRADVFVTDYADSRRLREDDTWQVAHAPRSLGHTLYAYAVPRGDPAWLAEVNGFLAQVKADGTLPRAAQRWGLREMVVN